MSKPRIAIIVGTTREKRFAMTPARWLQDVAATRGDMEVELVDLRDYPMPFFDEPASNAHVTSRNEVARRWQAKVASFDGFVFVTAEYNHSISAVLKNALDYAAPEWHRKPAAYLGYGGVGAARAVEHLRGINVELQMAAMRAAVHIGGADFIAARRGEKRLEDMPHLRTGAQAMLEQLAWWARALKTAREADEAVAAA
ncbi:MAG: NAD(P)H-dependent oxidoreductase [Deinococcales bacterium]|jgi:NAD(P)H-dependent FMN reductase